jgi:3-oxoacyl-[acyl-carrier protein] reductase
MKEVQNTVALVTGAGGGIGAATARNLAVEGAAGVVLADIAGEKAEEQAAAIEEETGCRCIGIKTDVSSPESISALFDKVKNEFGKLDILVNCAGICPVDPIEEITPEKWDRTMNINLRSAFLCSKEALIIMKQQKSGAIISVTSISGRIGGIATGVDYCTSKGGMIAMTKTFAKAAGPYNVRVNAVAPGFINTDMAKQFSHFKPETVPLRRIGEPEDVADVILFLASRRSRYITGCTLDITGGVYMS